MKHTKKALLPALIAGTATISVASTAIFFSSRSPEVRYEVNTDTVVKEVELPEPVIVEKIVEVEVPVVQTVEVEVPVEVIVEKTVEVEVPVEVTRWVTADEAPTHPLTGEETEVTVDHSAVAVKIANNNAARPQYGLTSADIVFEEVINDNLTRFLAVFHSETPSHVGPIRSSRTQDIDLLASLSNPLFLHSGANGTVTAQIAEAVGAGLLNDASALSTSGYWRGDDRPAPHNLYASVPSMLSRFSDSANTAPTPVFTYADSVSGLEGFRAQFSMDSVVIDWTYDEAAGNYIRRQQDAIHQTVEGAVTAVNVVIMEADYGIDPLTPIANTVGSGDVSVMREGKLVHGTWSRASETAPFVFTSASGQEIPLAIGNTWVEIARSGTHVTFNRPVGPCSLVGSHPNVTPGNCIEGQ